ncbi:hypothetical protein COCOBI_15-0490 [Coccomyxa sp. Obi]|nr:hypothetical protein COCOBI_15-0490 [Coccomyxa sp. Obi]
MKLPPKLVLTKVSKHPDLIDRRRGDLEQWLWRVVANAEMARSPLVLSFLELSEAVRVIPHATPAGHSPNKPAAVSLPSTAEETAEPCPQEAHIIAQQDHMVAFPQERQMRLGFRIEQRTLLKKHIKQLRRHLDEIETDVREAATAAAAH